MSATMTRSTVRRARLPFAAIVRHLELAAMEVMLREGSSWRKLDRPSWVVMARVAGVDTTQLYRWRHYGLDVDQADRLAVALGLHPLNVWPDWS